MGGSAEGAEKSLAVPSAAASAPPPRACVVSSGVCGGFSGGCGGDNGQEPGNGVERLRQRREAGLGERRRRAARLPAGSAGRGAGLWEEVTDPVGGDGLSAAGLAVFTSRRGSPL